MKNAAPEGIQIQDSDPASPPKQQQQKSRDRNEPPIGSCSFSWLTFSTIRNLRSVAVGGKSIDLDDLHDLIITDSPEHIAQTTTEAFRLYTTQYYEQLLGHLPGQGKDTNSNSNNNNRDKDSDVRFDVHSISVNKQLLALEAEVGRPLNPSVFRFLYWLHWPYLLFVAFLNLCLNIVLVLQPLFLNWLVTFLTMSKEEQDHHPNQGYLWAALLSIGSLLQTLLLHHACFHSARIGIRMRVGLIAIIFEKILALKSSAFFSTTTGQIITLISNDAGKFADLMDYSDQFVFSHYFAQYREKALSHTDERIKKMNEAITGINIVKMYNWEVPLKEAITATRSKEFGEISKKNYLKSQNMAMYFVSLSLATFFTFAGLYWLDKPFTSTSVFTTIMIFHIVRLPVCLMFPVAIELGSEALISSRRIEQFLRLPSSPPAPAAAPAAPAAAPAAPAPTAANDKNPPKDVDIELPVGSIELIDATFAWDASPSSLAASAVKANNLPSSSSSSPPPPAATAAAAVSGKDAPRSAPSSPLQPFAEAVLRGISLSVKPRSLVAIFGQVASGKSSLLNALLGEMTLAQGQAKKRGKIAYCGQKPWIYSGTVRENILFGKAFDKNRYDKVLEACALGPDLKLFQASDATMIGERGVNLSGGQKARVALARAAYSDADLLLLDDPLSAVDAFVGRSLFQNAIGNGSFLGEKTRLLVTHQTQYLPLCDHIIFLQDGQIAVQGTFEQILQAKSKLPGLAQLLNAQEVAHNNDAPEYTSPRQQRKQQQQQQQQLEQRRLKQKSAFDVRESKVKEAAAAVLPEADVDREDPLGIIDEEEKATGYVSWSVYLSFLSGPRAGMLWLLLVILFIGCQVAAVLADWWLVRWSNAGDQQLKESNYLIWYLSISAIVVALALIRSRFFFYLILQKVQQLHLDMLHAVLYSPLRFFEANPTGRILNRFSRDQEVADDHLPWTACDFFQGGAMVAAIFAVVAALSYYNLFFYLPICLYFIWLRKYYLRMSIDIKRLIATTRSPILAHLSATLSGLTTIRAYNRTERSSKQLLQFLHDNCRPSLDFFMLIRWFGMRLDLISTTIVCTASFLAVFTRNVADPASVGFALTYALQMTDLLQWVVRQSAEMENHLTSVERIIEYSSLEPEGQHIIADKRPSPNWPEKGLVSFKNVTMKYRQELDSVLKGITVQFDAQSKVGICGRTGSGKSSMLVRLFRMSQLCGGEILIDGVDISSIGLSDLRSRVSSIPQDPVLFSGFSREEKTMEKTLESGLDTSVAEEGSNFSVGQRQLLCLARALLRNNKLLCLDEATSSVDRQTDAFIQRMIRKEFSNCTIITIAHRLDTILDYDKVLVLDKGDVVEFDTPSALLKRPESLFARMVKEQANQH